MSYKILYKCDRCKKDNLKSRQVFEMTFEKEWSDRVICKECLKSFKEWWKNGKSK